MILTDREIQIALERGQITIDPAPVDKAFSSTSVDLTLDRNLTTFRVPKSGHEPTIDPSKVQDLEDLLKDVTTPILIPEEGYLLPPKTFVLGWTTEFIHLKTESRLAARIEGKSSLARLGIGIHITAPTIHSGFNGRVRLEIINHGTPFIKLRAGMRIAQLVFELTLGTPVKGYSGQFSGQTAPPAAH